MQCGSSSTKTDKDVILQTQASGQFGKEQVHQSISAPFRKIIALEQRYIAIQINTLKQS